MACAMGYILSPLRGWSDETKESVGTEDLAGGGGTSRMRVIVLVTLGLAILSLSGAVSRGSDPLRDDIEQSLRRGILEVWFPRALDRERGGFLCDFTYDWKPAGRQPKSVVFQSRLTWLASQAVGRYPKD